jgi:hypothetical protein
MLATAIDIRPLDPWMSVNPLQRVIADAMANAGMPLDQRGSKAELSRRSGVSETIIGYIFNRPAYLPDDRHRKALAKALGIPKGDLDNAGAAIKGLRAHTTGPDVLQQLGEVRSAIVLGETELSPAQLKRAQKELARLADEVAEQLRRPGSKG